MWSGRSAVRAVLAGAPRSPRRISLKKSARSTTQPGRVAPVERALQDAETAFSCKPHQQRRPFVLIGSSTLVGPGHAVRCSTHDAARLAAPQDLGEWRNRGMAQGDPPAQLSGSDGSSSLVPAHHSWCRRGVEQPGRDDRAGLHRCRGSEGKDVTMPKFPPPPRSAQNSHYRSLRLAVTNVPSASTTSAAEKVSTVRPSAGTGSRCRRRAQASHAGGREESRGSGHSRTLRSRGRRRQVQPSVGATVWFCGPDRGAAHSERSMTRAACPYPRPAALWPHPDGDLDAVLAGRTVRR